MIDLRDFEIIDCTLRDGGFQNDWRFNSDFAKDYVRAVVAAGVRLVEVGYFTKDGVYPEGRYGPWRHLTEDFVREMCGDSEVVPCAMGEVGRFDAGSIPDSSKSVVCVLRIASYWHPDQIEEAVESCRILKDKGYFVTLNLVAASTRSSEQIRVSLESLAGLAADVVYLVDSFGAFTPSEVTSLTNVYREFLPDTRLGLHPHNNRQLAIANGLAAKVAGAQFVDCSLRGMGRGAGNCPIEGFIGLMDDPDLTVLPILRCLDTWADLVPGPAQLDLRYLLTGMFNRAQTLVAEQDAGSLEEFFDFLSTTEHSDSRS